MSERWAGITRLLRLATGRSVEGEVDDEIAFHLESRTRDLIARGIHPAEAHAMAEREYGNLLESRRELIAAAERRHARMQRVAWWESLHDDLRFSARAVLRAPGVSLAVVTLLSLGVGANVAVFAVADQLLLRAPAGIENPSTVARLYLRTAHATGTETRATFEYATYDAFAAAAPSGIQLAAYRPSDSLVVRTSTSASARGVAYATSNFFDVLGVKPSLGRTFSADEGSMGRGVPVAVISHALWTQQFHGDSTVLGSKIEVAMLKYTIIGIAPKGFAGPDLERTDVWLPLATQPAADIGGHRWYQYWRAGQFVRVIARLGATGDRDRLAALATVAYRNGERANVDVGQDTAGTVLAGPVIETLGPYSTPPAERVLTMRLVGVALIVLLIACANVANLLFVRALRRRREIAVRLSLGIQRSRLIRQLIFEGMCLALVSAVVSLAVGVEGGAFLRSMILPDVHWATGTLSWQLMAMSCVAATIAGLLSAFFPALQASRTDLNGAIRDASHGGSPHRSRARAGLVAVQTALSIPLLAGAGLFVFSLRAALSTDLGYDADRIISGTMLFRDPAKRFLEYFSGQHDAPLAAGLTEIAERLSRNPNVDAVALSANVPLGGYVSLRVLFQDGTEVPRVQNRGPSLIAADPAFARTTGMSIVRGRFFNDADRLGTERVVVVSETAAHTYWPGVDPIGQCLLLIRPETPCAKVIGVTRDTHLQKIVEPPTAELFVPMVQYTGSLGHPQYLVARVVPGQAAVVVDLLRRELIRALPSGETPWVTSAAQLLEPELRPWRLGATLFSIFGALATIVATFGIYSVLSYAVGQRMHEMGVRVALGARRHHIVHLVLGDGAAPIVAGVVVGLVLTLAMSRVLDSMVFGTSTRNPWILAGAGLALVVTGMLGGLLPAWRATRVDPASALRAE